MAKKQEKPAEHGTKEETLPVRRNSRVRRGSTSRFVMKVTSVVLYAVVFFFFVYIPYNKMLEVPLFTGGYLIVALYVIGLSMLLSILGGFKVGEGRMFNTVLAHAIALVIANVLAYFVFSLVNRAFLNVLPIVIELLIDAAVAVIWAKCSFAYYRKHSKARDMLLVYGDEQASKIVYKILQREDRYRIRESIKFKRDETTGETNIDEVKAKINRYNSIIVYRIDSETRNDLIKYAYKMDIEVYLPPRISDIIVRGATEINQFDSPLLVCKNCSLTPEQQFIKRAFDIVCSLLGIIVLSPIFAIISLAIKLYDGGPVLYKQKRVTLNGAYFDILKFRSMVVDAEKFGEPKLATDNDKRITPVGKVIRMIRFDELPQLFNILKGDMSFVGPRPERVELHHEYTKVLPEFPYRTKVKAGLTGFAQIYGKYNTLPYDKLLLDLEYIQNFSFFLDIKLIILTLKIMFVKESTEGFSTDVLQGLEKENKEKDEENEKSN